MSLRRQPPLACRTYGQRVPALFITIGITPKDKDPQTVPTNHSPRSYLDESGLILGIRALGNLTLDDLGSGAT